MKRITVPEEGIETLFGSYDENLKHLEALFNVRIRTQGHDLLVEGESPNVDNVDRVVGQLSSLMRDGYKLSNADVKTASDLVAQDNGVDLRDHFLKGSLTSAGKRRIAPKTVNQRRYLDAIEQHDIVFGIGPAGTGKTYLAMAQAVAFLVAKKVSRIILARPAVEAGEKLGFLPGDLQEKVNPYLRPLYDALYDMLDAERVARYIERGTIEIAPISFVHLDARDVVRHKLVQQIVKAYEKFSNGNARVGPASARGQESRASARRAPARDRDRGRARASGVRAGAVRVAAPRRAGARARHGDDRARRRRPHPHAEPPVPREGLCGGRSPFPGRASTGDAGDNAEEGFFPGGVSR